MCGISGYLSKNELAQEEVINKMTDAIQSRGPDERGIHCFHNIAFGHRRLSIIDLASGQQPFSDPLNNYCLSFNGEIYNFLELKSELEQLGYQFTSYSDTEVLLYSYIHWGEACVNKLRGMFAFAVLDKVKQEIFLARDHLGIKPLVYLEDSNHFAFSSEIQALKKLPRLSLEMDIQAIDQYLLLGYIPAPLTIYKQIKKLEAGHYLRVNFDGKILENKQFWQFKFQPDYSLNENEWLEELEHVLRDSVQQHLVSDVPFGAFLSGGVDSSTVVTYMSQYLKSPVNSFCIGFDDKLADESHYAEIVAQKWQTKHLSKKIHSNAAEILPELVKHYGEPFADSSAIPTYYVCQEARKNVKMVLSGDGADEIFGGYHSYMSLQKTLSSALTNPLIQSWRANHIYQIPENKRRNLWHEQYSQVTQRPIQAYEKVNALYQNEFTAQVAQQLDIQTYLPDDILRKVDIASMMHGLEVRTPFVDHKVYDFASRIPPHFNYRMNKDGNYEGKLLLKKLLSKHFPKDFIHRFKKGFGVPASKWFSHEGELGGLVQDRLMSNDSPLLQLFSQGELIDFSKSTKGNNVWMMLFLDEWMRQEKDIPHSFKATDLPHAPFKADNGLESFIKSFIKQRFKLLLCEHQNLLLFPAGAHSKWLCKEINKYVPSDRLIISDDSITEQGEIEGYKTLPMNEIKGKYNVALLSSDCPSKGLKARAEELFPKHLLEIYEGLPVGPYVHEK